mmetsp:Transcript_57884/g.155498  ORF Transcript_57884/g.155498 Transcript_57884/m.155498 type:complete len:206 (+) Transcript_57884:2-619(+)
MVPCVKSAQVKLRPGHGKCRLRSPKVFREHCPWSTKYWFNMNMSLLWFVSAGTVPSSHLRRILLRMFLVGTLFRKNITPGFKLQPNSLQPGPKQSQAVTMSATCISCGQTSSNKDQGSLNGNASVSKWKTSSPSFISSRTEHQMACWYRSDGQSRRAPSAYFFLHEILPSQNFAHNSRVLLHPCAHEGEGLLVEHHDIQSLDLRV